MRTTTAMCARPIPRSAAKIGRARSIVMLLFVAAMPAASSAQSLLDRPPNMGSTWVGNPGTIQFHFMHRFEASTPPTRKVVNSPAFLLSVPLPAHTMIGARYATNSVLVSGFPNEWEFFGRFRPLSQADGAPLDLAVHGAFNHAADSWDGELAAGRQLGSFRLHGAFRGFSSFQRGDARWAAAGGGSLRLHQFVALAGDVGTLLDRDPDQELAWSAGLHLAIPYTPHTLSLHVANTHTTTLQGASLGTIDGRRWGFEFTIPFTPSRYFGSGAGEAAMPSTADPEQVAAEVLMTNQFAFQPAEVRIRVGEAVRWRNTSEVPHTVTADPARAANRQNVSLPEGARTFHSATIAPGAAFTHTFTVAGEYRYVCLPHEAGMVGRVIVE